MNGTTLERPDVAAYLDAVRSCLADLPADERDDLVADVEASLLEAGEPPALSPQEFAAELREAAGLTPEARTAPQPSPLASLRAWLASERAESWLRTGRELAPIWWLARAYVAVAVVALTAGWGWPVGSGTSETASVETSGLVLILAAVLSVWLGLRGRRRLLPYRGLRLAVTAVLAVALVPVAVHSLDQLALRSPAPIVISEQVPGLAVDGELVRNVYPYSRDGRLLHDVLLYDQLGRPLDVLAHSDDPDRRVLETKGAGPMFNSFPIRYFEPGTGRVAQPNLAPPIALPEVVTPPFEAAPR